MNVFLSAMQRKLVKESDPYDWERDIINSEDDNSVNAIQTQMGQMALSTTKDLMLGQTMKNNNTQFQATATNAVAAASIMPYPTDGENIKADFNNTLFNENNLDNLLNTNNNLENEINNNNNNPGLMSTISQRTSANMLNNNNSKKLTNGQIQNNNLHQQKKSRELSSKQDKSNMNNFMTPVSSLNNLNNDIGNNFAKNVESMTTAGYNMTPPSMNTAAIAAAAAVATNAANLAAGQTINNKIGTNSQQQQRIMPSTSTGGKKLKETQLDSQASLSMASAESNGIPLSLNSAKQMSKVTNNSPYHPIIMNSGKNGNSNNLPTTPTSTNHHPYGAIGSSFPSNTPSTIGTNAANQQQTSFTTNYQNNNKSAGTLSQMSNSYSNYVRQQKNSQNSFTTPVAAAVSSSTSVLQSPFLESDYYTGTNNQANSSNDFIMPAISTNSTPSNPLSNSMISNLFLQKFKDLTYLYCFREFKTSQNAFKNVFQGS